MSESTKSKEIVFEEERETVTVPTMLNRIDNINVERNTVEPKPIVITNDPIVNQPIEPNVEVLLRRSQRIRSPAISDDYVYFCDNDFNIGQ